MLITDLFPSFPWIMVMGATLLTLFVRLKTFFYTTTRERGRLVGVGYDVHFVSFSYCRVRARGWMFVLRCARRNIGGTGFGASEGIWGRVA